MLIGIDASRANRDHRGGPEWYSYYLIKYFARLDDKNQYILFSDEPLRGGLLDLAYPEMEKSPAGEIKFDKAGFQIIKSPNNNFRAKVLNWPFKFLWTQGRLSISMLKRKLGRLDVLFIPAHTLPFFHPKNSIVTIHDVGFERNRLFYDFQKMGPESRRFHNLTDLLVRIFTLGKYGANSLDYQAWSVRYALRHAKIIFCPSQFTKSEVLALYKGSEDKIKVIPNGFNDKIYTPATTATTHRIDAALEKYGIKRPYLFYVGRLERKKNIPGLVEAYGIMRDKHPEINHKLVLAGNASFGYDEATFMASEYDVENDVIMPGWVEERDLPYLYQGADAFVFPSRYEGFGIPLLQAMGAGLPVTASHSGPIPEVAGDAALLFDGEDVYKMSEALYEIITNEELRKTLIARGLLRVKDYSWEKCARETLEIIKSLGKNNKTEKS